MAIHRFVCDMCGVYVEDTDTKTTHYCPRCKEVMRWDINFNCPKASGAYEHVSDSLAIHPEQIPEHRKLFPNVEVLPDGRPKFTSVKQQEKYANRCGFTKKEQKIRKKGKRI